MWSVWQIVTLFIASKEDSHFSVFEKKKFKESGPIIDYLAINAPQFCPKNRVFEENMLLLYHIVLILTSV